MALRLDYNDFPFNTRTKAVWYLLMDWENRKASDYWSVAHKIMLVKSLKEIIEKNQIEDFEIYGIWQGNYSSDLFKIPLMVVYNELSKYF
jgi:hypothetical protein